MRYAASRSGPKRSQRKPSSSCSEGVDAGSEPASCLAEPPGDPGEEVGLPDPARPGDDERVQLLARRLADALGRPERDLVLGTDDEGLERHAGGEASRRSGRPAGGARPVVPLAGRRVHRHGRGGRRHLARASEPGLDLDPQRGARAEERLERLRQRVAELPLEPLPRERRPDGDRDLLAVRVEQDGVAKPHVDDARPDPPLHLDEDVLPELLIRHEQHGPPLPSPLGRAALSREAWRSLSRVERVSTEGEAIFRKVHTASCKIAGGETRERRL